jgi:hypothetical protein
VGNVIKRRAGRTTGAFFTHLTGEHDMAKVQGAKNRRAVAVQAEEVLSTVKGLNFDSVSKSITETQVEVQKVLADLSARVMQRLEELQTLEEAIGLKKDDLKQHHDIAVTAATADELEAAIIAQRKDWDGEQAEKKRLFAEQQSERNKTWKREEEEYQYKLAMEHRKQEDAFRALMEQQQKTNRDKQEELTKQWNEREGELKKRENEFAELKAFKEAAPEMVKKQVNQEVAIATNSVKKEYETKMTLASKDAETDKRLFEQERASLTAQATKYQAQIEDLNNKLEQAQRDAKDIAAKALESASGRATTEALQRLMEKDQVMGKGSK